MTWSKLSDDFADDCWTLSDAAWRLHVEGIIWSNRKLLDCRISAEDLRQFKRPEAIRELLDREMWEQDGDWYVIVHHSLYQRKRKDVIKQQDANRANGSKGGKAKAAGPSRELWQQSRDDEPKRIAKRIAKPVAKRNGQERTGQGPALEVSTTKGDPTKVPAQRTPSKASCSSCGGWGDPDGCSECGVVGAGLER